MAKKASHSYAIPIVLFLILFASYNIVVAQTTPLPKTYENKDKLKAFEERKTQVLPRDSRKVGPGNYQGGS
ncbi:hypothetical protein JCGZ_27025 [Jatropha curcas]|uniref:Transmembrane protein n=1 Tax=Jatropha curcas TaxID=180498 RepID=A0A067L0Q1_JATCU|nr:hypothetical protein JCGZ_27025 [Jatropha curcas]